MNTETRKYNDAQAPAERAICRLLAEPIDRHLPEAEVDAGKLGRWLSEARDVQWDYKNVVRRRGRLERLR